MHWHMLLLQTALPHFAKSGQPLDEMRVWGGEAAASADSYLKNLGMDRLAD